MTQLPSDLILRGNQQPLEYQGCGCVVDWGWDTAALPPPVFIEWCCAVIRFACPWHGGESGRPLPIDAIDTIAVGGDGATFYARPAGDESIGLGVQLTADLLATAELVAKGKPAVLESMPPKYRTWLESKGYPPADHWIEHRLMAQS